MRKQLTHEQIQTAVDKTTQKLNYRLAQKGFGTFASRHEILGTITEEYYELIEAVHANKPEEMQEELLDLAVGAIFAVACLDQGTLDR
jgi:NTP pyrophosphatase (non-canonical NTP hydrolase)